MLQEYSISDMFPELSKQVLYHVCPFEKIEQTHLVWPHRYDYYSIIWFLEGSGFNTIDFSRHVISPNRLFLSSPRQIHNEVLHKDAKGYILIFNKAIATFLNFRLPYVDICTDNALLLKLVIENIINKKSNSNIEIDLLYFYSLIMDEIDDKSFDHIEMISLFNDFKKLILTNDQQIQSLSQYAETLCISLASLNAICQNLSGNSAKQYLLNIKITEAKRLLIYSQLNISTIAYQIGFEDTSYFARIFKKKTTFSPSSFLKKYRK